MLQEKDENISAGMLISTLSRSSGILTGSRRIYFVVSQFFEKRGKSSRKNEYFDTKFQQLRWSLSARRADVG